MTPMIRDKGALVAAIAALAIALAGWMRGEAARSQQLSDLVQEVQQLQGEVAHLQTEIDTYLLRHSPQ